MEDKEAEVDAQADCRKQLEWWRKAAAAPGADKDYAEQMVAKLQGELQAAKPLEVVQLGLQQRLARAKTAADKARERQRVKVEEVAAAKKKLDDELEAAQQAVVNAEAQVTSLQRQATEAFAKQMGGPRLQLADDEVQKQGQEFAAWYDAFAKDKYAAKLLELLQSKATPVVKQEEAAAPADASAGAAGGPSSS